MCLLFRARFSFRFVAESPKVAVDLIIFTIKDEKLQTALVQMKKKPFEGMWAFPGGLVRVGESLDEAARRELAEKTGLLNVYLEQLFSFGDPRRDPYSHVVSVAYFALIPSTKVVLRTNETKYSAIAWFPMDKLPKLAYDHEKMAKYALQRLRWKLEYTNVVYSLMPRYFTLGELQRVYEIILGKKLDKRNFRKKILHLGLVKKTKKVKSGGVHRPAALYEFTSLSPRVIEVL